MNDNRSELLRPHQVKSIQEQRLGAPELPNLSQEHFFAVESRTSTYPAWFPEYTPGVTFLWRDMHLEDAESAFLSTDPDVYDLLPLYTGFLPHDSDVLQIST